MGLTHVEVKVRNPGRPARAEMVQCLVDSGSGLSVIPAPVLRRLGIKPRSRRTFILADGTSITRRVGNALFEFQGEEGASPVIFGEPGDSALLGTVTLEALGFILDPFKRELRPMPMLL